MMSMISRNDPHSTRQRTHGRSHSTSSAATQANPIEPEITIEYPNISFEDFIQASHEIRDEVTHLKPTNLDYAKQLRENIEFNLALFPHPENSINFLSTETNETKIIEPLCNLLETLDLIIQTRVNLHAGRNQLVGPESKLDLPLQRIIEEISYSILTTFFYPLAANSRSILNEIVMSLKTITNHGSIIEALEKRNKDILEQSSRIKAEPTVSKKSNLVVLDPARRHALLHAVEKRQAA